MYTNFRKRKFNTLSKILFILNIPLIVLFLSICYIYHNGLGVFEQGFDILVSIIIFALYFAIFFIDKNKVCLANLLLDFAIVFELRSELPLVITMQHSETVFWWHYILTYFALLCIIVNLLALIYSVIKFVLSNTKDKSLSI